MSDTETLKSVLHFTDDDLAANREGRPSQRQIARIVRQRLISMILSLIRGDAISLKGRVIRFVCVWMMPVPCCLLAGSVLARLDKPGSVETSVSLIICVGPWMLIVPVGLFTDSMILTHRLRRTGLEGIGGPLIRGNPGGKTFEIDVGGSRLSLPFQLYDCVHDGAYYRVYTFKDAVLSLEQLDRPSLPPQAVAERIANYLNGALRRAFEFDDADLAANREGNLSDRQWRSIRRPIFAALPIHVGSLFIVLSFLALSLLPGSIIMPAFCLGVFAVAIGVPGLWSAHLLAELRRLRTGGAKSVAGCAGKEYHPEKRS